MPITTSYTTTTTTKRRRRTFLGNGCLLLFLWKILRIMEVEGFIDESKNKQIK